MWDMSINSIWGQLAMGGVLLIAFLLASLVIFGYSRYRRDQGRLKRPFEDVGQDHAEAGAQARAPHIREAHTREDPPSVDGNAPPPT